MSKEHHDPRWRRLRRRVLFAHQFRCQDPAGAPHGGPLQVDHIVPVSAGGALFSMSNLQPLCRQHHRIKTYAERGFLLSPDRVAWRAIVQKECSL